MRKQEVFEAMKQEITDYIKQFVTEYESRDEIATSNTNKRR